MNTSRVVIHTSNCRAVSSVRLLSKVRKNQINRALRAIQPSSRARFRIQAIFAPRYGAAAAAVAMVSSISIFSFKCAAF